LLSALSVSCVSLKFPQAKSEFALFFKHLA